MATLSQTILSDQWGTAEMLTLTKQAIAVIILLCAVQVQRVSERTSLVDEAVLCTHGNKNHERLTETLNPYFLLKENRVTNGEAVVREAVNPF